MSSRFVLKTAVTASQWVAGGIMLMATALVLANVLGRYLLGEPIAQAEEILQYMNVWMVMMGSVIVTQHDAHLCLDLRPRHIPAIVRRLTNGAIVLLAIAMACYIIVQSIKTVGFLYEADQHSISAGIPLYLMYLVIPIAFSLSLIFLVRRLWLLVRGESEEEANKAAGLDEPSHAIEIDA